MSPSGHPLSSWFLISPQFRKFNDNRLALKMVDSVDISVIDSEWRALEQEFHTLEVCIDNRALQRSLPTIEFV